MIEVFDFQKNFETGKEIRKSKFKDDSLTKGVATIELFDSNSNLIEKTISNNFITNPYDGYYMYKHMAGLLEGRDFSNTYCFKANQFGQIHLRNGDFDEDPSTIFMRGKSIGWAERENTDSGSDVTKGAYNVNESYVKYEDGYYHAHLVYDFPTSKANGTINHIYWTPATASNEKSEGALSAIYINGRHGFSSNTSTGLPRFDARGRLFTKINDSYYLVKNKYQFLQGLENMQVDMDNVYSEINPISRRIDKDHYMTFTRDYKSGNTTDRYSNFGLVLRNSKTGEIVKQKDFDLLEIPAIKKYMDKATSSSACAYIHGIRFSTEKGYVCVALYTYAASNVLPEVSSNGTVTENKTSSRTFAGIYDIFNEVWVLEPSLENYLSHYLGNMPNFISVNKGDGTYFLFNEDTDTSTYYEFNEEGLSFKTGHLENLSTTHSGSSMYSYQNFRGGMDFNSNISISTSSNNIWYLNKFLTYSSHTKLPSPVIKTNTTTMKVTYDYYIQTPNLFAPKGKEFTWEEE